MNMKFENVDNIDVPSVIIFTKNNWTKKFKIQNHNYSFLKTARYCTTKRRRKTSHTNQNCSALRANKNNDRLRNFGNESLKTNKYKSQ